MIFMNMTITESLFQHLKVLALDEYSFEIGTPNSNTFHGQKLVTTLETINY